jgi:TolB-like protein
VVGKDDLIAGVWSGRVVSESTLSSRITVARQAIGDTGEQQRLIRTIPRKGFRFVGTLSDAEVMPPPLPAKPSIAILPFANLSESPEQQEYFADGVVEEIITALSQLRWLFVIARSSSFIYKGRAIDVKEAGRQLGVHYVIEGSVRKVGNKVRITAQLIDAMNGSHLWAESFDGGLEDIFDLQNQIAASIVGAIAPKLEEAEIERSRRKPTGSLGAYDFYLRATAHFHRMTRDSMQEALRLFYKAIELDETLASAYGMAAYCHVWRKTNGWARAISPLPWDERVCVRASEKPWTLFARRSV